jgi:hypothetical protein
MRWLVLLCALAATAEVRNAASDLQEIDEFNQLMQLRFQTAPGSLVASLNHARLPPGDPRALGMSRMVVPASFGQPFLPLFNVTRDFEPENNAENDALAELEASRVQVGLYLFGRAILNSSVDVPNYRALKGPAAMTQGAPRPRWYPTGENPAALPDALPDWKAIYPLAQRAMKSLADGGSGFDTSLGTWKIAVRPVVASQDRCVACHNSTADGTGWPVEMHQTLGGLIYAYRRSPA